MPLPFFVSPLKRLFSSLVTALTILALLLFAGVFRSPDAPPRSTDPLQYTLSIRTQSGEHRFTVEPATTPRVQERGLMYRRTLPPDRGMLFVFETVRPVSMWMKNTYISLDMLFLSPDGTILDIAERTIPESETLITPPMPVYAVLEVPGGTAERLNIARGDKVQHPLLKEETP